LRLVLSQWPPRMRHNNTRKLVPPRSSARKSPFSERYTHTHCHFMALVRDYSGGPVPEEETFTHSHMKSSSVLYQPPPSATIHSILPAQSMCFIVSLHNLYPSPLRSTSWSITSTTYSIHFFTQPLSSFRNTSPYHRSLFCCSIETSISSLSLNSLFETLIFFLWKIHHRKLTATFIRRLD